MEKNKDFSIKEIEAQLIKNYKTVLSKNNKITVPFFNFEKHKIIWLVYNMENFSSTQIEFKLLKGQIPPDPATIGGSVPIEFKIEFDLKRQKFSIGKSKKVKFLKFSNLKERENLIKKYYLKFGEFINRGQSESIFIELKTIFFDLFGIYFVS